jgi:diguanylate cyclase (GGDEF)-like protein
MTPTIIFGLLLAQFAFVGIGFVVWKRTTRGSAEVLLQPRPATVLADTGRCQDLLDNIGEILKSHNHMLGTLDSSAAAAADADGTISVNFCGGPCGEVPPFSYGSQLEQRVSDLGGVLERYDDLYLHERLQLQDYAGRAEELDEMLVGIEGRFGESGQVLTNLIRSMMRENRQLRQTVDGCRSRIAELVTVAVKSGLDARVDPLTRLPNRRAWAERINTLPKDVPQSVCVLDIDNFKTVNDQHGHAAGDAVLCLVARLLREEPRATAFRNGGDEFYLLMESKSVKEAHGRLDALRGRIERASVLFNGKRLAATITGGVAFPSRGEALDQTVARADEALYVAKGRGKNQIASSDTPAPLHPQALVSQ